MWCDFYDLLTLSANATHHQATSPVSLQSQLHPFHPSPRTTHDTHHLIYMAGAEGATYNMKYHLLGRVPPSFLPPVRKCLRLLARERTFKLMSNMNKDLACACVRSHPQERVKKYARACVSRHVNIIYKCHINKARRRRRRLSSRLRTCECVC